MNESEAIEFLSDVAFVAFPSVRQWLLTTDKFNATIKFMAKTLSDIDRDEADAVIDSWITGRVEAPKYLRDGFVLHIRACALERRQHRQRIEEARQKQIEQQQPRPESIMRTVQGHPLYTEHWLPMKAAVESGELDLASALSQWYVIVGIKASQVRG